MYTHHGKWSDGEHETVFRLADQGMDTMQIAMKMERTQNAVAFRIRMRKRYFDKQRSAARRANPVATISKELVPNFYAIGWRLLSLEDGIIVLEWPHARGAIYP